MVYAVVISLIMVGYAMYWYNKVHFLAYSEIGEHSQISKFKWISRTWVDNVDGSRSRVFGYRSVDNDTEFFIYLDSEDSRVQEFEKKDELLAFVDYAYIKDYFASSKKISAFRMLGDTPFAIVSGVSVIGYDNLDIYGHRRWENGGYWKHKFSKDASLNVLKTRIGVSVSKTEFEYNL